MTGRLDALCVEAKCEDHVQLDEAESRSADYRRIKGAIESMEQEILDSGEGSTIDELEGQAEGVDPDSLPGCIAELNNAIEDEDGARRHSRGILNGLSWSFDVFQNGAQERT